MGLYRGGDLSLVSIKSTFNHFVPTRSSAGSSTRHFSAPIIIRLTLFTLGLKGVFGSLTFGGYDTSRFVPNNISFSLAQDSTRDLVVGLQSITANYPNGSAMSLLRTPDYFFIDSTIPYIYLPDDTCEEFENAFGLTWNATYEYYFVDDALHEALVAGASNITFRLGNSKSGGNTVDISLPYSSFDLALDYPLIDSNMSGTRYFPLKRATNESQYTLGRTFLQEA